jgi:hypothetical protein
MCRKKDTVPVTLLYKSISLERALKPRLAR